VNRERRGGREGGGGRKNGGEPKGTVAEITSTPKNGVGGKSVNGDAAYSIENGEK